MIIFLYKMDNTPKTPEAKKIAIKTPNAPIKKGTILGLDINTEVYDSPLMTPPNSPKCSN